MRPSSGSSSAVVAPDSRATVSADFGGEERLGEHRSNAVCLHEVDGGLHVLRVRLSLRREAGDGDGLEAVPVGEVAERVVGGDELAALAIGEAFSVVAVERAQPGGQLPSRRPRLQVRRRSARPPARRGSGRARRADRRPEARGLRGRRSPRRSTRRRPPRPPAGSRDRGRGRDRRRGSPRPRAESAPGRGARPRRASGWSRSIRSPAICSAAKASG